VISSDTIAMGGSLVALANPPGSEWRLSPKGLLIIEVQSSRHRGNR
jgi:hypothetical protein